MQTRQCKFYHTMLFSLVSRNRKLSLLKMLFFKVLQMQRANIFIDWIDEYIRKLIGDNRLINLRLAMEMSTTSVFSFRVLFWCYSVSMNRAGAAEQEILPQPTETFPCSPMAKKRAGVRLAWHQHGLCKSLSVWAHAQVAQLDLELGHISKAGRQTVIFHLETKRNLGIAEGRYVAAHTAFLQASFQRQATLQNISTDYQTVLLVLKDSTVNWILIRSKALTLKVKNFIKQNHRLYRWYIRGCFSNILLLMLSLLYSSEGEVSRKRWWLCLRYWEWWELSFIASVQ